MRRRTPAQRHQHFVDAERRAKPLERRRVAGEEGGHQADERDQGGAHALVAATQPALGTLDAVSLPGGGMQLLGGPGDAPAAALDERHVPLHLRKRRRQPRRKEVRKQADGEMTEPAVATRDEGAREALPLVGGVPGETTPALRVLRTRRKTCPLPESLRNVLLGGQLDFEPKLHASRPGWSPPPWVSLSAERAACPSRASSLRSVLRNAKLSAVASPRPQGGPGAPSRSRWRPRPRRDRSTARQPKPAGAESGRSASRGSPPSSTNEAGGRAVKNLR